MTLEDLNKVHPELENALQALSSSVSGDSMVFSVSTKIQTTRGDKKAMWVVSLDRFGNVVVVRT